ncbi:MAG: VWA domain-containing protein [Candidatus Omnitrophota bacterium]|nr:VWA domain-containing protein [Candidatus Omnitrophota bacterium]
MSVVHWVILLAGIALIGWWGRRMPLTGWRRRLAIGCRMLALVALGMALWGSPARRIHQAARRVVYLLDGSASIDAAQQAWMARRVASLEALRPPSVERALVVFGQEAQPIVPFGRAPLTDPEAIQRMVDGATVPRGQTNLEGALLTGLALLTPQHPSSIVVLSDGRETVGNVTGLLAYSRRSGVGLFPVPTPLSGKSKTVWEELAVAPVVRYGSPIPVQVVAFNGSPAVRRGEVAIAVQGVPITHQRVALRPGWQVLSLSVPAFQRGSMALEVRLTIPEEGFSERREAYTEVEGPPQVLLVSDRTSTLPVLATALKRREMEIVPLPPAELPLEAEKLLDYDAVVLFNLPKSSLSAEQVSALRTYLEEFGGGLVMVGLGGDLAFELEHPAPLDPLLPVQFEARGLQQAQRRVCMMLLIDRSASMLGPRIAATKRAAVALVKQLAPEDLVGVLAFDTKPYVVAEVQPAGQIGDWLVEKLVKLRSTGGTDVYPALEAAAQRLGLTGAALTHIILLSDGNTPFHAEAYQDLLRALKQQGTTVSTIGIGAAFVNTDYLKWLAGSTGGTFYPLRALEELPQLMARDVDRQLGRLPFTEGMFRPRKTPATTWFPEIDDWPPLRGYFTTTAKPGALVELALPDSAAPAPSAEPSSDSPLLARWSLGQGRVAVFTSDADRRWSPDWIRWSGFEGTWAHVVRWAMRPRFTEELFAWVEERGGTPHLILAGELHDPRAQLIDAAGASARPLSLVQTGAWRWESSLEQLPSGWYRLLLQSHPPSPGADQLEAAASTAPVIATRWVQVGTPPVASEVTGQPPREALLRQLAQVTSGAYEAPDRAFLPPTASATTTEPALMWWLPLVVMALLVDIALRGSSMLS